MDDKDNGKVTEITPELQAKLDQIQANQETLMKKDKKVVPLIIAVIVLLLISAACVAVAVLTKGKNNDGNIVDQNGISEPEVVLSDVTDETVKTTMNDRFDAVAMIYYGSQGKNKKNGDVLLTSLAFTKNEELFSDLRLSDKEKIFITAAHLMNFTGKYEEKITKDDLKTDFLKDAVKRAGGSSNEVLKEGTKIKAEKFAEAYKELFGEDIKHQTVDECGGWAYYDAGTGYYYADPIGGCGGYDERQILIKRLDYKMSDENYFLEFGVTTTLDGMDKNGNEVCAIFKGYYDIDTDVWAYNMNDDKVAKSCKSGSDQYTLAAQIGENEMTKFRFVFDKEFHFKKIERL